MTISVLQTLQNYDLITEFQANLDDDINIIKKKYAEQINQLTPTPRDIAYILALATQEAEVPESDKANFEFIRFAATLDAELFNAYKKSGASAEMIALMEEHLSNRLRFHYDIITTIR